MAGSPKPTAPRVLVVDDSPTVRRLLSHVLRSAGCAVTEAEDGVAALEAIEHAPTPDLVLTDMHMPRMDGCELIRAIRAHPVHGHVHVLVVTSAVDSGDLRPARDAGANGWLQKPFTPSEVLRRLAGLGLSAGHRIE